MNKKRLFLLCLAAFWGLWAQGQGVVPEGIGSGVGDHLQLPRTGMVLYRNVGTALAGKPEGATNFALQNGSWRIKPINTTVAANDVAPNAPIDQWTQIELPDTWKWAGKTMLCARDMVIPFDYMDKQLYLRVEGFSGGRLTLYVNGERVGSAVDSRITSEWDITLVAKRGLNRVVLAVEQTSVSSVIEEQRELGGINRSVWLIAQPKIRVRDYFVRTSLDPTYTNGLLEVALLLKTELLNPHTVTIYYDLYDPSGNLVNQAFRNVSLDMRSEEPVRFTASILEVEKWSAETPSLYTVVFRVKREGRFTEVLARKVGFRTIETKGRELLINGLAPQIRGLNITERNDPKQLETELIQIKRAGFNALRTGNYPLPSFFYEQTDSLGFYVWSVANASAPKMPTGLQKGGTLANNPNWKNVFIERALANYHVTKNHPSVVAVALGSEAGNGYAMYHAYRAIKTQDAQRIITYDGAKAEWNTDLFCPVDPSIQELQKAVDSKILQPIIPSRVAADPAYWAIKGVQGAFANQPGELSWAPITWQHTGKANLYRIENQLQHANLSHYPVWVRVKNLLGKELWVKAPPIDCPAGQQTDYILNVSGKPLEVRIGNLFQTTL